LSSRAKLVQPCDGLHLVAAAFLPWPAVMILIIGTPEC